MDKISNNSVIFINPSNLQHLVKPNGQTCNDSLQNPVFFSTTNTDMLSQPTQPTIIPGWNVAGITPIIVTNDGIISTQSLANQNTSSNSSLHIIEQSEVTTDINGTLNSLNSSNQTANTVYLSNNINANVSNYPSANLAVIDSTDSVTNVSAQKNIVCKMLFPKQLDLVAPRRGRPKLSYRERKAFVVEDIEPKISRTRSGRLSKPALSKHELYSRLPLDDELMNDAEIDSFDSPPAEKMRKKANTNSGRKKKSTLPLQFRCGTCNKGYIGHERIQQHFNTNPTHKPMQQRGKRSGIWKHFIDMLKRQDEADQSEFFVNEITNFFAIFERVAPKMFSVPQEDSDENTFRIREPVNKLLSHIPSIEQSEIYTVDTSGLEDIVLRELEGLEGESGLEEDQVDVGNDSDKEQNPDGTNGV